MKGSGLWKMNCSILDDEDYIRDISLKIPSWIADGERQLSDNRTIWDWIKYNIRAHAIQYSSGAQKKEANKRSFYKMIIQSQVKSMNQTHVIAMQIN